MICTKLLQTAMNGLSKSASDEITPVARSKLRCGARIMPFLIVSLMAIAKHLAGAKPSGWGWRPYHYWRENHLTATRLCFDKTGPLKTRTKLNSDFSQLGSRS